MNPQHTIRDVTTALRPTVLALEVAAAPACDNHHRIVHVLKSRLRPFSPSFFFVPLFSLASPPASFLPSGAATNLKVGGGAPVRSESAGGIRAGKQFFGRAPSTFEALQFKSTIIVVVSAFVMVNTQYTLVSFLFAVILFFLF